jgi:hypothetical protein
MLFSLFLCLILRILDVNNNMGDLNASDPILGQTLTLFKLSDYAKGLVPKEKEKYLEKLLKSYGVVGHPALCILRKCENLICVQLGLCRLQRLMGKPTFPR